MDVDLDASTSQYFNKYIIRTGMDLEQRGGRGGSTPDDIGSPGFGDGYGYSGTITASNSLGGFDTDTFTPGYSVWGSSGIKRFTPGNVRNWSDVGNY